MTTKLSQTIDK